MSESPLTSHDNNRDEVMPRVLTLEQLTKIREPIAVPVALRNLAPFEEAQIQVRGIHDPAVGYAQEGERRVHRPCHCSG